MGRSSTSSNLVSGESVSGSSAYVPNFPSVTNQQHSSHYGQAIHPAGGPNHLHTQHQLPSPPHNPHHSHSQYLSHLANAANFYEANNNNNNNVTPPARVYSPMSHGSNSSTGSILSYGSSGGSRNSNTNNGTLTIMDSVNCVKYEFEDFPQEPDGGPIKIATWKDHVAVFNIDQVGVMCDVLLQEGDMPRLVDLLATVAKDFMGRSEKILRAQAHVAFHAALDDPRKFPQVYKILETNNFSSQYHAGLQKLWFNAHYKEAEITRARPLGAVDKYRIRRKFPLPRSIWDGEETVYCFKERSRNALRESFRLEKYPNLEEKKKLSKETGLTMTQVGNWFKNKRQREKEKEQGKQVTKRPKSAYSSPVGLAAMAPDILGMMLSTGGGGALGQAHLAPHHHHHHHHSHPSLQPHIPPLSPEDFENALRKARFADEAHRLKSYIDDGMYANSTSGNVAPYHTNGGGINNSEASTHGVGGSRITPIENASPPPRQIVISGKNDGAVGGIGSPGGENNNHHHQHPSPRISNGNDNGLTITAVQRQQSPGIEGSSPGSADGREFYGNRPRSNSSTTTPIRCGTEVVPYFHHGGHNHLHSNHVTYQAHHNIQAHHHHYQSVASPIPGGYENGVAPLIHNSTAAALSHA